VRMARSRRRSPASLVLITEAVGIRRQLVAVNPAVVPRSGDMPRSEPPQSVGCYEAGSVRTWVVVAGIRTGLVISGGPQWTKSGDLYPRSYPRTAAHHHRKRPLWCLWCPMKRPDTGHV
jgi:hypothetical protein